MTDSTLITVIMNAIQGYELAQQNKIAELESRIKELEEENTKLRQETEQETTFAAQLTDEALKERLASVSGAKLDTFLREATVLFENRLRQIAGEAGVNQHGIDLVDVVLKSSTGVLVFSKHSTEQEGIRLLYRGAMQYIRNPPMHNTIEYHPSMAQTQLRLVDALLQLLKEGKSRKEMEKETEELVFLQDVRRMLTRIPVPNGQILLYRALLEVGNTGITGGELAKQLNRTRSQLAGILGALGVRINNTKGLENKGGLETIITIQQLKGGEYLYKLKPVLKRALEEESILK